MGRKRAGGKPPGPPVFMARSFPLAGFGVVGRSEAMLRLFRSPCTCPDLGRFFCVGLHDPEASPKGKALGREEPSVADFRPSQGPEQNPICFLHGHAPGKKLFSPRECQLCWRGSGCIPQFWEPSAAGPKIPASPSPPSWGAGRYGRWFMGRRPGKKRRRTPAGSPQPEKVGPGRKNLFLPGVLSSGFLPKKAGLPPGAGRATTWQVWTCDGPSLDHLPIQRSPG